MLVRQVTAQVFGCDIKGVEIQLTVDEAASILATLSNGINNCLPSGLSHSYQTMERAQALFNAVSDAVGNK